MGYNKRTESATRVYHVYNRGNEKKAIYKTPKERRFMMNCFEKALQSCAVKIYAYCIMPNHYHLVLEAESDQMAAFIQLSQGQYGAAYHYFHNLEGHVFQGRYKSRPVLTEDYFWSLIRYIHLNPVKAGLVERPEDFAWSSFSEYTAQSPVFRLLDDNAGEIFRKHFPEPHNFYYFHGQRDFHLYDDISEEMDSQEREREEAALSDLKRVYGVSRWEEAGFNKKQLTEIVYMLWQTYHFDSKQLARLLHTSKYHVDIALNTAGIFN